MVFPQPRGATALFAVGFVVALTLSSSQARAGERAGEFVPFKARIAATAVPAGPCEPASGGPGLLLNITGGGVASYLGAVTDEQSHCLSLTTFAFTGGVFTLTGANGDTVHGTYEGQFAPNPSGGNLFVGHYDITGGTGRFAGATGGGPASGTENNGNAHLLLGGVISEPLEDRDKDSDRDKDKEKGKHK